MRIAQVAPLYEAVPPIRYGGTERVVSYLTEQLVREGHRVTLYASGDSRTSAELRPVTRRSLRLSDECVDQLAHHILMIERVAREAHEFDLIHWHIDYMHFPVSRRLGAPHLTTLHGRLDLPDLPPLYAAFPDEPVVSISDHQRLPLPNAGWVATVHHGLPPDLYRYRPTAAGYLAFLGRISPEKRVDRAIRIARRAGRPLRIAAKVDRTDQEYFARHIEPLLGDPSIEFLGEIGEEEKGDFLGGAEALLFPIDWPEPFGLVMIEAMACGTPVVAYRGGSVPEILEPGVTGYIVGDVEQAAEAARNAVSLPRDRVRESFERRFTVARMTADYVRLYEAMADRAAPEERSRTEKERWGESRPRAPRRTAVPGTG